MFIVYDPIKGGYIWNSPLEGWCFNRLKQMATKFATWKEAEDAINKHYRDCPQKKDLRIKEV